MTQDHFRWHSVEKLIESERNERELTNFLTLSAGVIARAGLPQSTSKVRKWWQFWR